MHELSIVDNFLIHSEFVYQEISIYTQVIDDAVRKKK
jgi:hypothetical protein